MTARRETTGPAAKLVLRPDRESVSADGEDVAMFAVEVQDAQGRTAPITDNLVTFRVSGPARLIGVGNGDPTDQSSDKGVSRKAFSGYCIAIVQAARAAGTISVEAISPGLASAAATITCKQAALRPQVAAWVRPIPKGAGISGLWRAVPDPASAMIAGFLGSPQLFTLTQQGGTLTGTVEGPSGFFGGEDRPVPIVEGTVAGDRVTFKSGVNAFTGTITGDRIELQRSITMPFTMPAPKAPDPNRPAIGPAPDGSDPSIDLAGMFGGLPVVVLKRASR